MLHITTLVVRYRLGMRAHNDIYERDAYFRYMMITVFAMNQVEAWIFFYLYDKKLLNSLSLSLSLSLSPMDMMDIYWQGRIERAIEVDRGDDRGG